jgi:hypothetical protein
MRLHHRIGSIHPTVFILGTAIVLGSLPVLAEQANFDRLTLAQGFSPSSAIVSGQTGGSTSLPAVVGKRDRLGNPCLGFGDPTPDHILELQADFRNLTVAVDSGGSDTTLIVEAPDGSLLCGDDTGSSRDASIADGQWPYGSYKVWVGSIDSGARHNYTLSVARN